jgi:chaperone required for assembly of F1-ATPase
MLGHVPLKTPAKNPLVLPTRLLAIAVAAEWECQERGKLKPHTMPLMSLTATAIDQVGWLLPGPACSHPDGTTVLSAPLTAP